MCKIISVSSLNLRSVGVKDNKQLDDPIPFTCSVCERRRKIGKNAFVMLRVSFVVDKHEEVLSMCDFCADQFTNIAVYGPRGAQYGNEVCTFIRASVQQKDKYCFNCLKGGSSHIFLKYKVGKDITSKRLCAKCSISYLGILRPLMVEKW